MAMSPMEMEQLKTDLVSDVSQTQERAQSAFATRGAPEETSFAPKAFRIAKRSFGEAELASADDAINKFMTHLKTEAAFKDQNEAGVFEANMRKKLNQYKMAAIRQAGEVEKRLAKAGVERAQRDKILRGITGLSEAAAYQIALGVGSAGDAGTTAPRSLPGDPLSSSQPVAGSLESFGLSSQPGASSVPTPGSAGDFGLG